MKAQLNPIQSRILTEMIRNGGYMTTAEIAKQAKISWNTAFAYLRKFEVKGWVISMGDVTKYWIAST